MFIKYVSSQQLSPRWVLRVLKGENVSKKLHKGNTAFTHIHEINMSLFFLHLLQPSSLWDSLRVSVNFHRYEKRACIKIQVHLTWFSSFILTLETSPKKYFSCHSWLLIHPFQARQKLWRFSSYRWQWQAANTMPSAPTWLTICSYWYQPSHVVWLL